MKLEFSPQASRALLGLLQFIAEDIGEWHYGFTTTIRDSNANKRQVRSDETNHVHKSRPELRIVEQHVWEAVQVKIAESNYVRGSRPGQKTRGFNYTETVLPDNPRNRREFE